ncbi:LANO_0G07778g1_1 [Lachancea nothofagi CBS 11611]|uniref:LANO_0G07778g1_1 n=1 Tax=Lachancea nothofagi CBS 11611 TaxID=1266666 RepID=A0A1G4KHK9_9SACH|nr:LANO_0G07778g1_1 [Lachancea nothofagi CBS 11611]
MQKGLTGPKLSWDDRQKNLIEWLSTCEEFRVNKSVFLRDDSKSGRGLYLKSGKIRKDEIVVSIPSERQLNFNTVSYHISKFNPAVSFDGIDSQDLKPPVDKDDPRFTLYNVLDNEVLGNLSSFQLLSLYILFEWKMLPCWNTVSFWKPFFDVFPTFDELNSIPALWILDPRSKNQELFDLLPSSSKAHAKRIASQVEDDWLVIKSFVEIWRTAIAEEHRPAMEALYQCFSHIYFIINSRCLYINVPLKDNVEDKFTMVPFVDFLNHDSDSDVYCTPYVNSLRRGKYGLGTFSIVGGSHEYNQVGEEVLLNYGPHSNDFLLNEYGFTLAENKWNYIDVSPQVECVISDPCVQKFLAEKGFWGEYTISKSDVSFRLIVAFAAKVCPDLRKVEKLMFGYLTEASFNPQLQSLLEEFLSSLLKTTQSRIRSIGRNIGSGDISVYNVMNIYEGYSKILQHHLTDSP